MNGPDGSVQLQVTRIDRCDPPGREGFASHTSGFMAARGDNSAVISHYRQRGVAVLDLEARVPSGPATT